MRLVRSDGRPAKLLHFSYWKTSEIGFPLQRQEEETRKGGDGSSAPLLRAGHVFLALPRHSIEGMV